MNFNNVIQQRLTQLETQLKKLDLNIKVDWRDYVNTQTALTELKTYLGNNPNIDIWITTLQDKLDDLEVTLINYQNKVRGIKERINHLKEIMG